MKLINQLTRSLFAPIALLLGFAANAGAQSTGAPEKTRENFMVVVRKSIGANKQDDVLRPTGKGKAKLADGREVEFEMASWEFIGDTHIRFVFDGPQTMMGAVPQDLVRLNVAMVEEALALAVSNVKRVYGEPTATSWTSGLMQVQGKSPDLDSTYFLDREFWRGVLKALPDGVVVAVPKRGGLLYAPLSDTTAVENLKKGVAQLHSSSGRLRVSSALYLFKDGKWSVYQAAVSP